MDIGNDSFMVMTIGAKYNIKDGIILLYDNFMKDNDHEELAEALNKIKGRAVISGYRTELYDNLFKNWERIDDAVKICHSSKGQRQESVWRNFQYESNIHDYAETEPIF